MRILLLVVAVGIAVALFVHSRGYPNEHGVAAETRENIATVVAKSLDAPLRRKPLSIDGPAAIDQSRDIEVIRNAANQNDAAAAALLANYSNKCQRIASAKTVSNAFLAVDLNSLTAEQRNDYQVRLDDLHELIETYSIFCSANGDQLVAHRLDILLRAADLGDERAAQCFIENTRDVTGLGDEADRSRYMEAAKRFIAQGMSSGNWATAKFMWTAHLPSEYVGQDQNALLEPTSIELAYQYAKLIRLGRGGSDIVADEQIESLSSVLTASERLAADAWANREFIEHFKGKPIVAEAFDACK